MNVRHGYLAGIVSGLVLDHEAALLLLGGIVIGAGAVLLAGQARALLRWGRHEVARRG